MLRTHFWGLISCHNALNDVKTLLNVRENNRSFWNISTGLNRSTFSRRMSKSYFPVDKSIVIPQYVVKASCHYVWMSIPDSNDCVVVPKAEAVKYHFRAFVPCKKEDPEVPPLLQGKEAMLTFRIKGIKNLLQNFNSSSI